MMLKKIVRLVCVGILLFFLGRPGGNERSPVLLSQENAIPLARVQEIFPAARSLHSIAEIADAAHVRDGHGALLGMVLSTVSQCADIIGYAGPVPLLIAIDPDERVVGISLLSNHETAQFVTHVTQQGLLAAWNGKTVAESSVLAVDAISGATMTSRAVIDSVRRSCRRVCEEEVPVSAGDGVQLPDIFAASAIALVFLLAVLSLFFSRALRRLRILLLCAGIGVLGFWQANMFSMGTLRRWLIAGANTFPDKTLMIAVVFAVIVMLVTRKNPYCGYVCPYGALQELVSMPLRKKRSLPQCAATRMRISGYVFLGSVSTLLVLGKYEMLSLCEPFAFFSLKAVSVWVWCLAGAFLCVSLLYPRLWCRFFCPTGHLLGVLCGSISRREKNRRSVKAGCDHGNLL